MQKKQLYAPKLDKNATYAAAVRYLQRFNSSTEQLRAMLLRRVFRAQQHENPVMSSDAVTVIEDVLKTLTQEGFLNDHRYASHKVSSLRQAGRSTRYIKAKMMEKGISETMTQAVLEDFQQESETSLNDADYEAACRFAKKKRLGLYCLDPEKRALHRQKHMATLARQGFSYEIAKRALEQREK